MCLILSTELLAMKCVIVIYNLQIGADSFLSSRDRLRAGRPGVRFSVGAKEISNPQTFHMDS